MEVVLRDLVNMLNGALKILQNIIGEDRVLERKAQFDRDAWEKSDLLPAARSLSLDLLLLFSSSSLRNVAVVLADHLREEGAWLLLTSLGDHLRKLDIYDLLEVSVDRLLNPVLVFSK